MRIRRSTAKSAAATKPPWQSAKSQAHAPNEMTWKEDLVHCAAIYALVPGLYKGKGNEDATEFRATLTDNDIK